VCVPLRSICLTASLVSSRLLSCLNLQRTIAASPGRFLLWKSDESRVCFSRGVFAVSLFTVSLSPIICSSKSHPRRLQSSERNEICATLVLLGRPSYLYWYRNRSSRRKALNTTTCPCSGAHGSDRHRGRHFRYGVRTLFETICSGESLFKKTSSSPRLLGGEDMTGKNYLLLHHSERSNVVARPGLIGFRSRAGSHLTTDYSLQPATGRG
jgi:hypothetical protein